MATDLIGLLKGRGMELLRLSCRNTRNMRAVGTEIRIKVGVDYLIDKVSQAQCDRLNQQRTCYLIDKVSQAHCDRLKQQRTCYLHTRQSKSESRWVDYLIDKLSQAHCNRLKQQRMCYLCGKTFKHWYTLGQFK